MRIAILAAALLAASPALAAHRPAPGMTLQDLLSTCHVGRELHPPTILLLCPAGCVVEIANGLTPNDPPRITVAPACRGVEVKTMGFSHSKPIYIAKITTWSIT